MATVGSKSQNLGSFVWSIAEILRGDFKQSEYGKVIRMFQRDNEMRNIVLTDPEARDKATRHFFNRALREVRETEGDSL